MSRLELLVYHALAKQPMSPTDVAEVLDTPVAGVYTAFVRLRASGHIVLAWKDGRCRTYRVTDLPAPAGEVVPGDRQARRPRRQAGDLENGYGAGKIALEEVWR